MRSELRREVWDPIPRVRIRWPRLLAEAVAVWLATMGLLFVMVALVACGPGARDKALSATLTGVNAARDGFVTFDSEFQKSIIEHAQSLDQGQDALHAYRERREVVIHAFTVAYAAVAAAAVDVGPDTLVDAAHALKELRDALTALRKGEGR